MPVSVPVTIADPPAAPAGYTLCAFEVRTYAKPAGMLLEVQAIATFAGTAHGFEDAANIFVKAVESSLHEVGVGLRLAAVAWWADRPLEECVNGRERLVSVYDATTGQWGEWTPEERVGHQVRHEIARPVVPETKHPLRKWSNRRRAR